jgi:hypothetical protein
VITQRKTPLRDERGAIFWDNDSLAALIGAELNADVVMLLSDVEGLYVTPPDVSDGKRKEILWIKEKRSPSRTILTVQCQIIRLSFLRSPSLSFGHKFSLEFSHFIFVAL